jgi:hypothetical protein
MTNRRSNYWLSTKLGYAYLFKPNEPVNVHPSACAAAQAAGAAYVNPEDEPSAAGNVAEKPVVMSDEERRRRLTSLLRKMADSPTEYRTHFTAGGRPNLRWVQSQLDLEFDTGTLEEVWREVRNAAQADAG